MNTKYGGEKVSFGDCGELEKINFLGAPQKGSPDVYAFAKSRGAGGGEKGGLQKGMIRCLGNMSIE